MRISRRGSAKNFGQKSIDFPSPRFVWNETAQAIDASQTEVSDFEGTATHDYTISISVTEVLEILKALSDAIDAPTTRSLPAALRPGTADAMRLVLAAVGLLRSEGNAKPAP